MTKNNEPEHGSLVSRSSIDSRFQWNIKDIYPDQTWLDGLYMGAAFYAEWQANFEPLLVNIKANCMTVRL
mgnify:CR=1 FL=1